MIEPSELEQGWYIARLVQDNGFGSLCLVWVQGRQPFLRAEVAVVDLGSTEWHRSDFRHETMDPRAEWQFIQRIDLPITEAA